MRWEIVGAQVLDLDADLTALCNLGSLIHLLLLQFLTLVHPFFLLFFLLEKESVWGKWEESEWSWGSSVGKYLQLMLTCGPCPLMDNSIIPTQSIVSALLSDDPENMADYPIYSGFAYPNLRTWSLWPWVHVEACNGFAHSFGEHKCLELGSSIGVLSW